MGKRKSEKDEKGVKRHKFSEEELWSESDDEQLMCDAAEEIERKLKDEWGDSDDDQLMCDAVDEWERLNQVGYGQPEPAQPPLKPEPAQPEPAQQPLQPEPVQPPLQPEPAEPLLQPEPAQPLLQAALNNSITSSTFIPTNNRDLLAAFRELEHQVQEELRRQLNRNRGIRAYITVDANFTRESVDGTQRIIQHFRSSAMVFNSEDDIAEHFADMMREIFARSQDFEAQGSGWNLEEIVNVQLHIVTYKPLSGSSYIPSPPEIQKTKAVLNVQNEDQKCIVWSIVAFFHPVRFDQHAKRVTKYERYEHELDFSGIEFPTPLSNIKKIEQQNNLSINVFGYDKTDKVYPLYKTRDIKPDRHINLLLIGEGENRHYCLIKRFSALMNYRTKHRGKTHYCFNCLHGFWKKQTLDQHIELCYKQKTQAIKFPHKPEEKKSVSRTPRSSCRCHLSSMLTLRHIQPRLMNHSMGTQQFTSDIFPLVLATWLSAPIHSTPSLQSSTEEKMLWTRSCNDLMTSNARSATFSVLKSHWS